MLVGTFSPYSYYRCQKNTSDPPGHQMGKREEDESTADVEEIVGGQTHHQEVEAPLASSEAEHQDTDGVADEADAEHDQLKISSLHYRPSFFI